METDEAKAIHRDRAQTIELANAQARNRGLVRLLARGAKEALAVALWQAIAHNVSRRFSLRGGTVVAEGPPEHIATVEASHTGRFLRPLLD